MSKLQLLDSSYLGLNQPLGEALALPFYQATKQPQGAIGEVDFRLCGDLARLLRDGLFQGQAEEALLMPATHGLGVDRLFLYGLGSAQKGHSGLDGFCEVLVQAGCKSLAWAPPGTDNYLEHAQQVLKALSGHRKSLTQLTFLDFSGQLASQQADLFRVARDQGFSCSAS